jgi:hypothetical protein
LVDTGMTAGQQRESGEVGNRAENVGEDERGDGEETIGNGWRREPDRQQARRCKSNKNKGLKNPFSLLARRPGRRRTG